MNCSRRVFLSADPQISASPGRFYHSTAAQPVNTHTFTVPLCSCLTCSCKTWAREFSYAALCRSIHIPNIMSASLVSFGLSAYKTSKNGFPLNQQVNKTKIWWQNLKRQFRLPRLHQFLWPPSSCGILFVGPWFPLIIFLYNIIIYFLLFCVIRTEDGLLYLCPLFVVLSFLIILITAGRVFLVLTFWTYTPFVLHKKKAQIITSLKFFQRTSIWLLFTSLIEFHRKAQELLWLPTCWLYSAVMLIF